MLRTILILVTALAVAVPQTADACGNPIHLAGNRATQKVKNYENWLKAGDNAKILRDAHRFSIQEGALRDRAHLVIAVAALRSNSGLPWTMRHSFDEGEDDSALGVLRALAKAAPDSPVVQARFAEGLLKERMKDEGFAAEATKILEDLATREVMPDAEAWNSLALARAIAKDEAGSAAAKAQCKKLARGRKHACK
jgi:hypothetical protein